MSFNANVTLSWNGREVKVQGRRARDKSSFEIGLVVEGQAKQLAPVDTGRLAGSITTQAADGQSTSPTGDAGPGDVINKPQAAGEVFVGTAVDYGPYIEFGTVRSNAQPFLRPALDLAQGKAVTIAERNGKLYLKEYIK
jgi:HK97 gp10 family phage protein